MECKICVLGDSAVGKTCLVNMFVWDTPFLGDYVPTLMDSSRTLTCVDREDIVVEIVDIGSALELTLIEQELSTADGFIFVFAIDDYVSFANIPSLIDKVNLLHSNKSPAMLLVGNKCDLMTRKVSTTDGQLIACNYELPYIETSAKMKIKVDSIFLNVIRLIRSRNQLKEHNNREHKQVKSVCCSVC